MISVPFELIPIFFFMILGAIGVVMYFWLLPRRRRPKPLPPSSKLFTHKKPMTDQQKRALAVKIEQSTGERLKKMPVLEASTRNIAIAIVVLGLLSAIWVVMLISGGFRKW